MIATINIAKDFSPYPGGRFRTDGPANGEQFRDDLLMPALRDNEVVTVVIDGVAGLPPSFLDEVFGGLVRHGFSPDALHRRLKVVAETPRLSRYPDLIWDYIGAAAAAGRNAV